jgi:2-polyprenyl-3-methyl-5-hydroxy-6-metoxy-1,4-benzoquinol methylase
MNMSCVACGGPLSLFGPRLGYEYHQCQSCRTIQIAPLPNEEELARAYARDYATAGHYGDSAAESDAAARTFYQSIVSILKAHNVHGLVVDCGSGWGGLCQMVQDNGFRCIGVDPSEEMAHHCQQRGLDVQQGDLLDLQPSEPVAAIVLCTVFEHLVNHEAWLAHAHRMLAPGGLIVTLQPTAAFANFAGRLVRLGDVRKPLPAMHTVFGAPWHTVLFSLDGFKALAEHNGFFLQEIHPAPQSREGGSTGLLQVGLETVNRIGWFLVGNQWPLLIAHTFVLQKV